MEDEVVGGNVDDDLDSTRTVTWTMTWTAAWTRRMGSSRPGPELPQQQLSGQLCCCSRFLVPGRGLKRSEKCDTGIQ
jgi:hypothetical protein